MFLYIQIDLIILKTYDQQFTLTTKKSLHIIFKDILIFWPQRSIWILAIGLHVRARHIYTVSPPPKKKLLLHCLAITVTYTNQFW